ncbi:histidine phosphatase superfamily [Dipodascopsis uninucleata]
MTLNRILVARHASRLDTVDKSWQHTSPTPYDSPLSERGVKEAKALGNAIAEEILASCSSEYDNDALLSPISLIHAKPLAPNGSYQSSVGSLASSTELSSSYGTDSQLSVSMTTSTSSSTAFSSPVFHSCGRPLNVYIHTSPFLRCAMTAHYIADQVSSMISQSPQQISLKIRMDTFLGEWLTPDYYTNYAPPPEDGHTSLAASSIAWLLSIGSRQYLDLVWSVQGMGRSGEYGERWRSMYSRLSGGLSNVIRSYTSSSGLSDTLVVFVTHGACCNALLGALSNKPMLVDVGIASLSVAVPRKTDEQEYGTDYGYGGERRDRTGGLLIFDDLSKDFGENDSLKWNLTRVADDSHLALVNGLHAH